MQLNQYIDHTLLKPTITLAQIVQLCLEATEFNFAAVCIPPPFVKMAKDLTQNSTVKVATVVGFPFGYSATEAKLAETVLALIDGADEIDLVAPIAAIKNSDWAFVNKEISTIIPLITQKQKTLKVIIESSELTDDEIIKCCQLYSKHAIHYLKTSTGYAPQGGGASIHAIQLFKTHLAPHIKIKASGGIKTPEFAQELIQAGASRLGTSSGLAIIGQSSITPNKDTY